jgi:hypothetical protein
MVSSTPEFSSKLPEIDNDWPGVIWKVESISRGEMLESTFQIELEQCVLWAERADPTSS